MSEIDVIRWDEDEDFDTSQDYTTCPECDGEGRTWEGWTCDYCDGYGWLDL